MTNATPRNIHAEITNQIIAAIEADPGRPSLPWRASGGNPMPVNTLSGKHYNGINILSLGSRRSRAALASRFGGLTGNGRKRAVRSERARSHPS